MCLWLVVALCLGALALGDASGALARGTGAILGFPAEGRKANCFIEHWGGVQNICDTSARWVMPAIVDGGAARTFEVRARGVAGTPRKVRCEAWQVNNSNDPRFREHAVDVTDRHDGLVERLTMLVANVGWGAHYVLCDMDPGTTLLNLHY